MERNTQNKISVHAKLLILYLLSFPFTPYEDSCLSLKLVNYLLPHLTKCMS